MMSILIYLLIGVFSGTLSGLLGIGGGIIVVPALVFWFQFFLLFPEQSSMHVATGTSLAAMIGTTLSAAGTYAQQRFVVWPVFLRFFPGLCIGMVLGSFLAHHLSKCLLMNAFAVFLALIGVHLLLSQTTTESLQTTHHAHNTKPYPSWLTNLLIMVIALCVGTLSTLFGIGGGLLIVPFFLFIGMSMNESSGTSALCGVPIAIIGTFILTYANWSEISTNTMPWGTIGNIYWPAALIITVSSMFFAHIGSKSAVKIKPVTRKCILSIILFLCSMNMLFLNACVTR